MNLHDLWQLDGLEDLLPALKIHQVFAKISNKPVR